MSGIQKCYFSGIITGVISRSSRICSASAAWVEIFSVARHHHTDMRRKIV